MNSNCSLLIKRTQCVRTKRKRPSALRCGQVFLRVELRSTGSMYQTKERYPANFIVNKLSLTFVGETYLQSETD